MEVAASPEVSGLTPRAPLDCMAATIGANHGTVVVERDIMPAAIKPSAIPVARNPNSESVTGTTTDAAAAASKTAVVVPVVPI